MITSEKVQTKQTVAHACNSIGSKRQSNTGYVTCNTVEAGVDVWPYTQLPRRGLAPARASA